MRICWSEGSFLLWMSLPKEQALLFCIAKNCSRDGGGETRKWSR